MKKIELTVLFVLLAMILTAGIAQAQWRGYYRGWGPPIYWGVPPIVFAPPLFPLGYYPPPPPAVVRQAPVYVRPRDDDANYWYYCECPKGYYPYISSCPSGWMKVVPHNRPSTAPLN
jgi:hypothetical protein